MPLNATVVGDQISKTIASIFRHHIGSTIRHLQSLLIPPDLVHRPKVHPLFLGKIRRELLTSHPAEMILPGARYLPLATRLATLFSGARRTLQCKLPARLDSRVWGNSNRERERGRWFVLALVCR